MYSDQGTQTDWVLVMKHMQRVPSGSSRQDGLSRLPSSGYAGHVQGMKSENLHGGSYATLLDAEMRARNVTREHELYFESLADKTDASGARCMSKEAMVAAFAAANIAKTPSELDEIFRTTDIDGNGVIGTPIEHCFVLAAVTALVWVSTCDGCLTGPGL